MSPRVAVSLIVVAAVVIAGSVESILYYSEDLPRGSIVRRIAYPEDTEYAPSFKESEFARIVPGMSIDDVVAIVGMPLSIVESTRLFPIREYSVANGSKVLTREIRDAHTQVERQIYDYTKAGRRWDNYYIRTVIFDPDGHVIQVNSSFYSD